MADKQAGFVGPGHGARDFGRYGRLVLLGMLTFSILNLIFGLEGATVLSPQEVIAGIEKVQQNRDQKLAGYNALEYYKVHNSHFKESAELAARVFYTKSAGKSHQILWRRGPEFLQKRVINRILNEDDIFSRGSERSNVRLTSANYRMKVQGIRLFRGERCYVVNLRPRVNRVSMIEGTAWFKTTDFSLLRIEGKPAASPSFWTGRPFVEREYTVIDGFSFPKHSRATSSGFLSGKSELDIDYSKYEVSR